MTSMQTVKYLLMKTFSYILLRDLTA